MGMYVHCEISVKGLFSIKRLFADTYQTIDNHIYFKPEWINRNDIWAKHETEIEFKNNKIIFEYKNNIPDQFIRHISHLHRYHQIKLDYYSFDFGFIGSYGFKGVKPLSTNFHRDMTELESETLSKKEIAEIQNKYDLVLAEYEVERVLNPDYKTKVTVL
jgi:hypothetical protein